MEAHQVSIDPEIHRLAQEFVADLTSEVGRTAVDKVGKDALVERLAKAMQVACEQEYEAVVNELTA
jgi:hypothetical protein